jgi:DNA-binding PadR family transcriptional regulator
MQKHGCHWGNARHGGHSARWAEAIQHKMAAMNRGFEGWGEFPFGGFERGRGGRGRGRMFGSGELRLVLLKLIADEPRHGYELIKAIEELTGGAYAPSPGTVYPTLSLLEDEGAIAESADGEKGRKAFAATDQGLDELAEKADEVEALLARLAALGDRQQGRRPPELGRAFANLGRVLANRFAGGRLDAEAIEQIVDIIDEAAKRIERL